MKTIRCILLLPFLLTIQARSQEAIRIGFQSGVVYATEDRYHVSNGIFSDERRYRTGFIARGIFEMQLSPMLSVEAEPGYAQRGFTTGLFERWSEQNAYLGTFRNNTMTAYLELPVIAKLQLRWGSFSPCIQAGKSIGYLLEATSTLDPVATEAGVASSSEKNDVTNGYERWVLSLHAGLGCDYWIGSHVCVTASGRYILTYTNIAKWAYHADVYSHGFEILAGLRFALTKPAASNE